MTIHVGFGLQPARRLPGPTELQLELENVSELGTPIEIWWTRLSSMLDLKLEDETGTPLTAMHPAGTEALPPPFWLPLMYQSSVTVAIASRAYDYSAKEQVLLRPTALQAWIFGPSPSPSRLFMSGLLKPREERERHERAWRGPLALPRIEIPAALR